VRRARRSRVRRHLDQPDAILAVPGLSTRAGETIVVLANALAISLVALSPGLSRDALGVAILLIGGTALAAVLIMMHRAPSPELRRYRTSQLVMNLLATVPFPIAGLSLLAEAGGGLRWVLAGVVLSLLVGLGNGWVLLVEILR
jgi:hypothetical protein